MQHREPYNRKVGGIRRKGGSDPWQKLKNLFSIGRSGLAEAKGPHQSRRSLPVKGLTFDGKVLQLPNNKLTICQQITAYSIKALFEREMARDGSHDSTEQLAGSLFKKGNKTNVLV